MPISLAEGLHPSVSDPPPVVRTGEVISLVHLTVRDTDVVFPQPSLAVNVLVLARLHPLLTTGPSDELMPGIPQALVAVAVPREPSGLAGLQPRFTSV